MPERISKIGHVDSTGHAQGAKWTIDGDGFVIDLRRSNIDDMEDLFFLQATKSGLSNGDRHTVFLVTPSQKKTIDQSIAIQRQESQVSDPQEQYGFWPRYRLMEFRTK